MLCWRRHRPRRALSHEAPAALRAARLGPARRHPTSNGIHRSTTSTPPHETRARLPASPALVEPRRGVDVVRAPSNRPGTTYTRPGNIWSSPAGATALHSSRCLAPRPKAGRREFSRVDVAAAGLPLARQVQRVVSWRTSWHIELDTSPRRQAGILGRAKRQARGGTQHLPGRTARGLLGACTTLREDLPLRATPTGDEVQCIADVVLGGFVNRLSDDEELREDGSRFLLGRARVAHRARHVAQGFDGPGGRQCRSKLPFRFDVHLLFAPNV